MAVATHQVVPNAPDIKMNHGFAPSTGILLSTGILIDYPWAAIILMEGKVDETKFENMEWAYS